MYQKILVPLDGSELAECALDHAKAIAASGHSQVVLFQAIEPLLILKELDLGMADRYREAEDKFEAQVKGYLDRMAGPLEQSGIPVETAVVQLTHVNVAGEILNFAGERNIDLIVMSTHGRSGISRWAFGSVADRVVHHSVVPVLVVVPQDYRAKN